MTHFKTKYGHFSDNGREYIITNPATPRPWGNIISNGDFGMMISQNGSGYAWRGNAGQNRITRSYQDLIKDHWGEYFYLRDLDSKKFWSATLKPVMGKHQSYTVAHGFGYSRFERSVHDIASTLTVFVAPSDPVQLFTLTLKKIGRAHV